MPLIRGRSGILRPWAYLILLQAQLSRCGKPLLKIIFIPSDEEIKTALKSIGAEKIILEHADSTVLKKSQISIDLGDWERVLQQIIS
jgi:hypothetical protein